MENNNITEESVPGTPQLSVSESNPAVGGQNPQESVITLSELKNILGKDFKDKDSAFKSMKDTQSYVGQVGQLKAQLEKLQGSGNSAASGEVGELKAQVEALQEDTFFERNAQFKSLRPIVKTFAKANGKTLSEAIEMPELKDLVTKVSGFDESQRLRTVTESNPRLASSQTKITKAQDLAATRSRKSLAEAGELATAAVLEAYPDFDRQS